MRFDGGGIGHKSTFTAAPPLVGPDGDAEADGIGSGMGNPGGGEEDGGTAGGLHLEDVPNCRKKSILAKKLTTAMQASQRRKTKTVRMMKWMAVIWMLGPEDGEEAFEDDVLELEGYAPL